MAVKLPDVPVEVLYAQYEGNPDVLGRRDWIETQLRKSVLLLQAQFGQRIRERLDSGILALALYEMIVAEAALRVCRNPEGYTSEEQGNYSYTVRAAVASGYIMFTDMNMRALLGSEGGFIGTSQVGLGW